MKFGKRMTHLGLISSELKRKLISEPGRGKFLFHMFKDAVSMTYSKTIPSISSRRIIEGSKKKKSKTDGADV